MSRTIQPTTSQPLRAAQNLPGTVRTGVRAALAGLRLGLRDAEVRRSYLALIGVALVLSLAFDAGGLVLLGRYTAIAPDASFWQEAQMWALWGLGVIALLIATPLLVLVVTRVALPLLAERIFFAALRRIDPERARALEAREGLSTWVSVLDSVQRLLRFAGLTILLFALGLIPVIGPVVAFPLQAYFTARALGWELLDPYFAKLGLRLAGQRRVVGAHRALLVGFGAPLLLLFAIPVVGPLLLGLAQAAAAQLVHDGFPQDPASAP